MNWTSSGARDQQRRDQTVDAHALARPRGARDEQMRHAGEVGDDRLARDVHADADGQSGARELGRGDQITQLDHRHRRIGHFDADHRPTWNGRQHAQRRRAESQGQIVLARDDAIDRHAGRRIDAELGDRRSLLDFDNPRLDVERQQRVFDDAGAAPSTRPGENEPPSVARPRMVLSGRFHGVRSAVLGTCGGRLACTVPRLGWGRARDSLETLASDGGPRMTGSPGSGDRSRGLERWGNGTRNPEVGTRSAASGASQPRMRSRPTRLTVAAAAAIDTTARPPLRPKPASSRPRIVSPSAPPPCGWRRASISNQVADSAASAVSRQTDGRRRRASIHVSQADQAGTSGAPPFRPWTAAGGRPGSSAE